MAIFFCRQLCRRYSIFTRYTHRVLVVFNLKGGGVDVKVFDVYGTFLDNGLFALKKDQVTLLIVCLELFFPPNSSTLRPLLPPSASPF